MKKKLFMSLALLMSLCMLLVSCGSTIKPVPFRKLIVKNGYESDETIYASASKMEVEGEVTDKRGPLAVFTKIGEEGLAKMTVFNVKTGASVFSASAANITVADAITATTYKIDLMGDSRTGYWFYVTETSATTEGEKVTTSVKITIYNTSGDMVTEASSANADVFALKAPRVEFDLIFFNDHCYRVTEDGIVDVFAFHTLRQIPNLDYKHGDYYYELGNETVHIYDKNLNVVSQYMFPSYAENTFAGVLESGDVFIQYQILCDDYSQSYTYIDEKGDKYRVTSLLINRKTDEREGVELRFIVEGLSSATSRKNDSEDSFINGKVKNLGYVYYIENERLDTSLKARSLVSLNNEMTVEGNIDGYVPGKVVYIAEAAAMNRWLLVNDNGQIFLLNEKGKILGEVTGVDENGMGSFGLIAGNKIFNWNLEVVCDLTEYAAVDYRIVGESVVFNTADAKTMAFVNGEVTTLIAEGEEKEIHYLDEVGFLLKDAAGFHIYNGRAEQVLTHSSTESIAKVNVDLATEDGAIVSVQTSLVVEDVPQLTTLYFLVK